MTDNVNNPTADDSVEHTEDKNQQANTPKAKPDTDEITEAEVVEIKDENGGKDKTSEDKKDDSIDDDESDEDEADDESAADEDGSDGDSDDSDNKKAESESCTCDKASKETASAFLAKEDFETARKNLQEDLREQIESCKFEIIGAIQEDIHTEISTVMEKQIRKLERRRRAGFWLRDIIILLLAAIVGFCLYCLYDAKYFDFMKTPESETANNNIVINETLKEPEVVKDRDYYLKNYRYLYDDLHAEKNADRLDAYYLYSGDYRVNDIPANYLLGMAYHKLQGKHNNYLVDNNIKVPANDLQKAFAEIFGDDLVFSKESFDYDCLEFNYDRATDSFVAANQQCTEKVNREIIEEIDNVYEEGNVLYFITTAAIYDKQTQAFYNFNNLFEPIAKNATAAKLKDYTGLLNHYQYQFKKVDDKYYFSGIVRLNY